MQMEFIAKEIINNLVKFMTITTQFSSHPESKVETLKGSLHYFSGCGFPFFNGVFNNYRFNELNLQDNLDEIVDSFSAKNRSFIWWWLQQYDIPIEIKKELDNKNFKCLGEFLGVAAELNQVNLNLNVNIDIKIKCIDNNIEYKKFIEIMCDVFQMTNFIKTDLEQMYQSFGPGGQFKHYLAYFHDEPVATLSSYIDGNIVGLYNGATLPKVQKNGLCSMLVISAIKDAIDAGCKYAVSQLITPDLTKGLSERLGFKKYCSLHAFLKELQIVVK